MALRRAGVVRWVLQFRWRCYCSEIEARLSFGRTLAAVYLNGAAVRLEVMGAQYPHAVRCRREKEKFVVCLLGVV